MNKENPFAIFLPTSWSPDIDQDLERKLKILEWQALALRWERFMHRLFQVWPADIEAVSFMQYRHADDPRELTLELHVEMPDRMYPIGPDGIVEGIGVLDTFNNTLSLRKNKYRSEVVEPFREELCKALANQPFPEEWVNHVLDCSFGSPGRTQEEWRERSQAKISALVGHYRLAAHLEENIEQANIEKAPGRRSPRI